MTGLAGVVLAAGAGTRLRPLTRLRPKALCPVANVPLVDLALERVRPAVEAVAVNVHHGRAALEAHLADAAVHVSVEEGEALGTGGALGHHHRGSRQCERGQATRSNDTWLGRAGH